MIDQARQVHDHILPRRLHIPAYVPFHEGANLERWMPNIVAGALHVPVLTIPVRAITSACHPANRAPELSCLHQLHDYMGFLKRPGVDSATPIGVRRQL